MDERNFTLRTQRQRRSERKARGRRVTLLVRLMECCDMSQLSKRSRETALPTGNMPKPNADGDPGPKVGRVAPNAPRYANGNRERGGLLPTAHCSLLKLPCALTA